jgi:hypothetical protein
MFMVEVVWFGGRISAAVGGGNWAGGAPSLYSTARAWDDPRVRFLLPLMLAIAVAGCSSPKKKAARAAARQAEQERIANSREIEERRLRAVDGREIASARAAEIYVADPNKTFDPNKTPGFGARKFQATGSRVKEFQFAQRAQATGFRTKDFAGNKDARFAKAQYVTADARTKEYAGPNAARAVETKTAPTEDAREASKTMATRALPGGNREYLGPEAERVKRAIEPGREPRVTNDLREIKTIEDIRELLNKNE